MKHKYIKKAGLTIAVIITAIVILFVLLLLYLTVSEYRPEKEESVAVAEEGRSVSSAQEFTLLSYNTGYAALSKGEDFFMDGGKKVMPDKEDIVQENLKGISAVLKANPADAYFLQEVDINSKRSYHTNEQEYYEEVLNMPGLFAYNFKCSYVPYPVPTIGHVESGLLTLTDLKAKSAKRISLPESFSWPIKTCNLKRCLLETRIPLQDSDKELVLINLHLEAYDDGAGKIAQSKMLAEILKKEYEKGNYVIAGGDFNQTFEGMADKYPIRDKKDWVPGVIGTDSLPEGFSFAVDDSYPTCRLLNKPYTGSYDTSQVYVIDGFILSPNVSLKEVKVVDTDFEHADHQPVKLTVGLEP